MTGDLSGADSALVQVALPEELLDQIDRYADREGTTRSAVVAAALEK
jgi:metal-responsive CopG/Arc/MetJ family transcriptional regulator